MIYLDTYTTLEGLVDTRRQHPCVNEEINPVLLRLRRRTFNVPEAARALGQYCFLSATIDEFLSHAGERLRAWPEVASELDRNVAEERGCRTGDVPHFTILKAALLKELGLDLSTVRPAEGTQRFLRRVGEAIAERPPAFVAGIAYALEDSAIQELLMVAQMMNEFAALAGREGEIIRFSALSDGEHAARVADKSPYDYTLEDYFVMHVQDFEQGHRMHLAEAVERYVSGESSFGDFTQGFEFLLNTMDDWWAALARLDQPAPAA